MKIFDLHNDALTGKGKTTGGNIIYAIWTTELSLNRVKELIENNKKLKLAIEDCGVLSDCFDDIRKEFYYVGLTWNYYNGLAGGAYSDEGLSEKGKEAIRRLNELDIPLDVAHLNRRSFFDAAPIANKIICSHTCFNEVNSNPRNLTREQISVIIEKGGVIGLCFVADFLGGNGIDAVIRHIDWFLSCFGDDNLAIGTDFYGTKPLPSLSGYEYFDRLVIAMIRQGYTDSTIYKILSGNASAYFKNRGTL